MNIVMLIFSKIIKSNIDDKSAKVLSKKSQLNKNNIYFYFFKFFFLFYCFNILQYSLIINKII